MLSKDTTVINGMIRTKDSVKTKDAVKVGELHGFTIEQISSSKFQAVDYGYIQKPLRLTPPQDSIEEVKKQIREYLK